MIIRLVLLMLSLPWSSLSAQECYRHFFAEGKSAYEALDFETAIKKFEAAKICEDKPRINDVDSWIIKTQNGYINAITAAREAAEKARDAETLARREAEENAARARFNALNAKALLALQKQDPNAAFDLAIQAQKQAQADSLSNQDLAASVLPEVYYNGFYAWEGEYYSPPFYQDLNNLPSQVQFLDVHPDGKQILVTCWQQPFALMLDTQGQELGRFAHESIVSQARFSPDGKHILSCSQDGEVRLWDRNGKLLSNWQAGQDEGRARFSPEGRSLLFAFGQGKVFNLNGQQEGKTFGTGIYDLQLSPDRKYAFTLSGTQPQLWQWQAGKGAKLRYTFQQQLGLGFFSPDSRHLLTAYRDSLLVFRIEKNGKKLVLTGSLPAHNDYIYSLRLSPDGLHVVSAARDQQIAIWSLDELIQSPQSARPLFHLEGHHAPVRSAVLDQQGNVYSGGDDLQLKLWALKNKPIPSLADHAGKERIRALAVSPFNGQLAIGLEDRLQVKDPQSLAIQGETPLTAPLVSLAFSKNGGFLAGINTKGEAIVWAWEKGVLREIVRRLFPAARKLTFSPQEELLALTWGPNASIWDWKENKMLLSLDHHETTYAVAISPDGKQWLVTTLSGKAWLWPWEIARPDPLALPAHQGTVFGADISVDGSHFLSTAADGLAWIGTIDGDLFQPLRGHTGPVLSGAFSPSGNRVATVSADGLVILWNLNGDELFRLPRLNTFVEEVHFSPDGHFLYIRDSAGRGLAWEVEGMN